MNDGITIGQVSELTAVPTKTIRRFVWEKQANFGLGRSQDAPEVEGSLAQCDCGCDCC